MWWRGDECARGPLSPQPATQRVPGPQAWGKGGARGAHKCVSPSPRLGRVPSGWRAGGEGHLAQKETHVTSVHPFDLQARAALAARGLTALGDARQQGLMYFLG